MKDGTGRRSAATMPLAAVPGALFGVWHNVSGAIFAGSCARRGKKEESAR